MYQKVLGTLMFCYFLLESSNNPGQKTQRTLQRIPPNPPNIDKVATEIPLPMPQQSPPHPSNCLPPAGSEGGAEVGIEAMGRRSGGAGGEGMEKGEGDTQTWFSIESCM